MKLPIFTLALSLTLAFAADVTMTATTTDSPYPDAVRLTGEGDRVAFLEWFATIAEAQYTAPAPDWAEQDCAGLLRYAYTEALKPKDAQWFAKFAYLPRYDIAPVRGLRYPMPVVSRSVFRIAPGSYRSDDVEAGRLVGLATAAELMRYNTTLLGRTPDKARRGDLLFYAHPTAQGSGYHSMVYLGSTGGDVGGGMVVYHTGLHPDEGGEVRLLSLETLARHPDKSWHPTPDNPHFLGFYRWKLAY